jgi:hypothetical protein
MNEYLKKDSDFTAPPGEIFLNHSLNRRPKTIFVEFASGYF